MISTNNKPKYLTPTDVFHTHLGSNYNTCAGEGAQYFDPGVLSYLVFLFSNDIDDKCTYCLPVVLSNLPQNPLPISTLPTPIRVGYETNDSLLAVDHDYRAALEPLLTRVSQVLLQDSVYQIGGTQFWSGNLGVRSVDIGGAIHLFSLLYSISRMSFARVGTQQDDFFAEDPMVGLEFLAPCDESCATSYTFEGIYLTHQESYLNNTLACSHTAFDFWKSFIENESTDSGFQLQEVV